MSAAQMMRDHYEAQKEANLAASREAENAVLRQRNAELFQTLLDVNGELSRRVAHWMTAPYLEDEQREPRLEEALLISSVVKERIKRCREGTLELGQDAFKDVDDLLSIGDEL